MKPIPEMYMCHIEVTSHCMHDCLYCSRYIRHLPGNKRWHMDLETVEKCASALKDWPNLVGVIGGEPSLHPRLPEICRIITKYIEPERLCFFTAGGQRYEQHKEIIHETFKHAVHLNRHDDNSKAMCLHQPATIAIKDVVADAEIRRKLINNCWVQKTWCPTSTPRGGFFCEVAAALDNLFELGGGYSIEERWWDKTPHDYQDQVCRYCDLCGMAIPMPRDRQDSKREKVSKTFIELAGMKHLPIIDHNRIEYFDHQFTRDELIKNMKSWDPGNYRQDKGIEDRQYINFTEI